MRKAVSVLFISVFLFSCSQQERNCKDYKTGTFSFDYVLNGEEKVGKFTRDNTYSVEYYDNKIDSATVKWVNDCEFVLQDLKSKTSVHMKILSTTNNSYTFEYSLVGEAKKIRGTAIKTN
jgi:hypothetical protein